MATELQRRGVLDPYTPMTPLLRSDPAAIRAVHDAYVDAGATVLLAATFRALPHLTSDWEETIDRAVRLALAAAGSRARVAASFGPLGGPIGSWATASASERSAALSGLGDAVSRALAAGASAVVLETLVDVDEGLAMITATRARGDFPLVASWVPRSDGALLHGADPRAVLARARDAGADLVGFNCAGPEALESAVARCDPAQVTWCKPSRDGAADDALVAALLRLARHAVVGGCCGVGPEVLARLPPTIRSR